MAERGDFFEYCLNASIRGDDKSTPLDAHEGFSHEGFFPPHTVGLADCSVWIGDERVGQLPFGNEFGMACGSIRADAEDARLVLESCPMVAQGAGLDRATWGAVLGVKDKNYGLAAQGGKGDFVFRIGFYRCGGKIRCHLANLRFHARSIAVVGGGINPAYWGHGVLFCYQKGE